jgi:glutaminyl-peptide cyclotransferase
MKNGYGFSFLIPPRVPPLPKDTPVQRAEIVRAFPHDPGAFTQGLLCEGGSLFESTGMEGRSELRELRLEDGAVLRRAPFPPDVWGEGIASWRDEIIGLTLRSGLALRWRRDSFAPLASLPCAGAGWGLARIGDELAISDGTSILRFVDPETFEEKRRLSVREDGRPLPLLNDLAYVGGELLANIYSTYTIARVDPATGQVQARIDLSDLVARSGRRDVRDALNGIAYDEAADRLFVTGKNWPSLFEIRVPERP